MLHDTELGAFTVDSGALYVGDPGYRPHQPGQCAELHVHAARAHRGVWRAFARRVDAGASLGTRCAERVAHAVDRPVGPGAAWTSIDDPFGVDSGQAGVFDEATVGHDALVPAGHFGTNVPLVPDEPWCSMRRRQTLSALGAGVIPGGAASSSGLGDGAYPCFLRPAPDGSIDAVRLVFLPREDITPDAGPGNGPR